jgi:hypothetical protein
MKRQIPIHELQLGSVRATIWEESSYDGPKYQVSISRAFRRGESSHGIDRFEPEDLPVIAEVVDLAHLWICEQAELIV